MKKHITMTYIEVLEGMLSRKQADIEITSSKISAVPDVFNKKRFVELCAEVKMLETCLDLAKVMFDGEENNRENGKEAD
ncbi:MAG: hypothetical protein LBJ63_10875 [Prevotellaceae bacterium]|jgi:hypothetical protein|nr:hypothetical protein [Prevotellaceae bacterium]